MSALRGDETGRIALFVRFRREADMDRCAASPASVVNDPKRTSAGPKSRSAAIPAPPQCATIGWESTGGVGSAAQIMRNPV
jgi:hypothetical protein